MENNLQAVSKSKLLIGVLLLVGVSFAIILLGAPLLSVLFGWKKLNSVFFLATRFLFWGCLLMIWQYAIRVEKQPLLMWDEKNYSWWKTVISIISVFVVTIGGLTIITAILLKLGFSSDSVKFDRILVLFKNNYFILFFTALTAGIVEELTFRGYLLPRLTILVKSPTISILFSSVLFGLMHYSYGTIFQVAGPFFIGLVFAFYYYEFRNIKIIIFCHFLWDVSAIMINIYKK